HSHATIAAFVVLAIVAAGCAARSAYSKGDTAARAGDWDAAVEQYRKALQEDPQNVQYRISYERANLSAAGIHIDAARLAEARGQLDQALMEFRRASEYDPANRAIAGKVLDLERKLRDQIEQSRPRPSAQQIRQAARAGQAPPLFNFNSVVQPIRFQQASLRDIFNFVGEATGINVTYDSTYQDRVYTVNLVEVTLEQALQQIVAANALFYKVMNPKTIMIIPDNAQKRAQYEEQVIVSFPLSYVDSQELAQTINQVIRPVGQALAPAVTSSKSTNTVTIRATTSMMAIIERMIETLDKPRAEIVVDVQILEVSRNRAQQYGLDLGTYAINAVFSPEVDPRIAGGGGTTENGTTLNPRPFNLNTVSRGISTSDFYLAVPSAVVRFLETDSETKVIAKPQLRGAEGSDLKLNLGEDIPVPSTTFTPLAQGGANFNPLTSFTYRPVGVTVQMTPRVSIEGDIQIKLMIESSNLGAGITIAGQELPSFGSRRVETDLRLREGESTLLAGLLQEQQRRQLSGIPWVMHLPVIKQLFSANDNSIQQSDVVMLLTPRIVRSREFTASDLGPIYIGTQSNLGLSGPPPLIGATPEPGQAGAAAPAPAGQPLAQPQAPAPAAVPAPAPQQPAPPAPNPLGAPVPGPTSVAAGQVVVSVPSPEFRVGGGPYLVPISITNASQLSGVTLTVTYNPAVIRLVNVQEGSFMRAGGVNASFTQQPDPVAGRVDIAVVRRGDITGVAGTGLLAGLLFEPVAPGAANLNVTGSASGPNGSPVSLQFSAVPAVRVQ
ncbi:MAG TPA: secretin N-terminal domain-containing protein, partial [Vicinamibacterales bacterium]|nr:secretin N-terminal domain-containing protein [Vicinamibacterales bacterium]